MNVTKEDIEEIASEAIKRAFRDMGITESDPFEMRKDFAHLREWRITCEQVRSRGTITLAMLVLTGLIGLLVLGFKGWIFH